VSYKKPIRNILGQQQSGGSRWYRIYSAMYVAPEWNNLPPIADGMKAAEAGIYRGTETSLAYSVRCTDGGEGWEEAVTADSRVHLCHFKESRENCFKGSISPQEYD